MTSLTPVTIGSYDGGGMQTNVKPFMLMDQAFPVLENAYVYRDRVIKRQGLSNLGRLRRVLSAQSLGLTSAGTSIQINNIFTAIHLSGLITGATNAANCQITTLANHSLVNGQYVMITNVGGMTELNNKLYQITVTGLNTFTIGVNSTIFGIYTPGTGNWQTNNTSGETPEIQPFSVTITIDPGGTPIVLGDTTSEGTLTFISGPANQANSRGVILYRSGLIDITLQTAIAGNLIYTIPFSYYPNLPVMGEEEREVVAINDEQEVFFDTKYAYIFTGGEFTEFIPGYVWAGTNSNFFWMTNYRGSDPQDRLFFETNFSDPAASAQNRMRYTDQVAAAWTDFTPAVDSVNSIFMARILISYYGRLLALGVYEGSSAAGAVLIPNRCRFSQIGSPIAADAWRSDQFGKGGFIDAPTLEKIISATFYKNTLIVQFERTTWQLRYVGEYGLPFIWERISSDFGAESTFSTVLFDEGVLAVGDKAIVSASAVNVSRIDLQIPDVVFNDIRNADEGQERVHGIRDYQRELVYWNFAEADFQTTFPNKTLVYNYRNNTYAMFRNNVTVFGNFNSDDSITWDSLEVFWNDKKIKWEDSETQSEFPYIVCGNQQGWVHYYGYQTEDEPSLTITAITVTTDPVVITSKNHNLQTGEIVEISGLLFFSNNVPPVLVNTSLNDVLYQVEVLTTDTFAIYQWNGSAYISNFAITFTGVGQNKNTVTYVGGGKITLIPKMYIQTKDFNPFLKQGTQAKLSYVDFLTSTSDFGVATIQLFANTSPAVQGNLIVGNTQNEQFLTTPYYTPASDIAWHRFYATLAAQFFRIVITYDDELMNETNTHEQDFELNAMRLWVKPGGRTPF